MLWTVRDEDTLQQCVQAEERCAARGLQPMPWFTLVQRMYQELEQEGLIQRVVIQQRVCENCVQNQDGCKNHYMGAHVDQQTGEVMFCPHKTTKTMRDAQMKLHKRRGRA